MEENQTQQEKIFYQDSKVTVTQSRYVADGKTYVMRNISSVSNFVVAPSIIIQVLLIIMGLALLSIEGYRLAGIIILAIGIILVALSKKKYAVRINTNAGETNSFESRDKDYIQKIVDALNEAIIQRG